MKSGEYFVGSGLRQSIANARGKVFTQLMSMEPMKENPSRKKAIEDGVRMGGYEVNIEKTVAHRTDMRQPMARYSEFWIG